MAQGDEHVVSILTERLELVPATPDLVRAALVDDAYLGKCLPARIPETWPPEFYEPVGLEYTLAQLEAGPEQAGWWLHYFVQRSASLKERVLIGTGGYKGPPTEDGTVEIGYTVASEYQRQGYATEASQGLVRHAFTFPEVHRVVAETFTDLAASIGVLEKLGFRFFGDGEEKGVIWFELLREEYTPQGYRTLAG
jgi:RimJ/RimL family protein N-acetyltransferase